MTEQTRLPCRYETVCPYHILNCDEEFQHCGLFAKYARKEVQDRMARDEQLREAPLFDIGITRLLK